MLGTIYIKDDLKQAAAKAYGVSMQEPIDEDAIWNAIRLIIAKRVEKEEKEIKAQSTVVEENDITVTGT